MLLIKGIAKEIEVTGLLKGLVDIYGEIASIRMMKIRDSVLKNRNYIFSITEIFYDALASYLRKTKKSMVNQKLFKGGRITFLSHNGKMVFVFVSSNTGFYGDTVSKTFKKFQEDLKKENAEVTILGKTGQSMFSTNFPDHPYTFFEFPDYGMDKNKLLAVINHLVQYDEVRVYYNEYLTVLNQEAVVANLTAGARLIEKSQKSLDEYIFEPSVEKILEFFEKEVFGSFFDQTIRESQLSKLSGRIIAMDKAAVSIKNRLKVMKFDFLRAKHNLMNKKQLNLLSSFATT